MKFAEHLSAHITPEWRKQYINYEEMKAMLYTAVEEAPSMESADPDELTRHFKSFKETFFAFCDTELKKINTFYSEKLAEATRKFATLKSELSLAMKVAGKAKPKLSDIMNTQKKNVSARKVQDLKLAFSEYYLSLILLQNYQNLNFTGFRKILKKHDKLLNTDQGAKYREEYVEAAHFHTNTDIGRLITEVETTVTGELEGGDRQKAMKRLRVPPLGEKQTPWTTFKVGLFSGSFIVLFCAVLVSAVYHNEDGEDLKTTFKLFRAPLLLVEFLFLIGVNIYGWRSSGVNHVLIFELDPRNHLSEQDLMELAAIMGVVWTLSLLCFFYSPDLSIPRYFNPIGLVGVMFIFFLNPFKVLRHDARWWTVKVMWKCIAAPFYYVNFADFWLADQFNSLVTVFVDFHYIFYFYFVGADEQGGDCCSGTTYIVSKSLVNCIPGLDAIRSVPPTLQRFERSVPASRQCRQILHYVLRRHFQCIKNHLQR
uniref:SPX domain-containing protein n=1 Tax=Lygus hesperus TaxID=30085 RepID=A0A0A9XJ88_LYGHE